MKVGFLTASVSRRAGGVLDGLRRLAQELAAGGTEVWVAGLRDADTESDLALWDGVPVFAGEAIGPAAFSYCPVFGQVLTQQQAELLHLAGLWMYPSVACRRWASRKHIPYLVAPHGMLDPWALRNSVWKKKAAAWLYENQNLREAACLHALCAAEVAAIRAYGLRNPVCVVPNGVDIPDGGATGAAPWQRVFPQGVQVLLFLGRLHPKKNVANLLRAWARAEEAAESLGWRLVVAGWDQGGHGEELKSLAGALGVGRTVWLCGELFGERKDAALRQASAFVLPSLSEGLPVAVLEAWAYRLLVVMTRESNLPEGFENGAAIETGSTPEEIEQSLRELFALGTEARLEMGRRGRRLVEERFRWPEIAAQMKQVYEWMLGGGAVPDCVLTPAKFRMGVSQGQ